MNYRDYNDNELLSYVSENNEEASEILYKKYLPLITNIARKMSMYVKNTGVEVNDLIQEGMLGLSNAINEYSDDKNTIFYTFAKTCIERKIITAVTAARRLKHRPLNDSVPLEASKVTDDNQVFLDEVIGDNKDNPENMLLDSENFNEIISLAKEELTDFEMQVFELRISDFGYKEIAEILEKDIKAIDNALQRIKSKLKKINTGSING